MVVLLVGVVIAVKLVRTPSSPVNVFLATLIVFV